MNKTRAAACQCDKIRPEHEDQTESASFLLFT